MDRTVDLRGATRYPRKRTTSPGKARDLTTALEAVVQHADDATAVTYHSNKPTGPTAGIETTDALEFLAQLTSHILAFILARDELKFLCGDRGIQAWQARIAAVLGDRDRAISLLQQAVEEGFSFAYPLHRDEDLVLLRGYEPFEEFVRPKG